jgi:hypothetical protein
MQSGLVNEDYMLDYEVLSDEQMEALVPKLEDGEHQFECIHATAGASKSGNKMLTLEFKTWNNDGLEFTVKDWIVLTPSWAYKLKRYWESVGEPDKYNGRNKLIDFTNKFGVFKIKNEIDDEGNKRPRVKAYIRPEDVKKPEKQHVDFGDTLDF